MRSVGTLAKSVSLPGDVIRVLSEDDNAHLVERRRVEGIEDEPPREDNKCPRHIPAAQTASALGSKACRTPLAAVPSTKILS